MNRGFRAIVLALLWLCAQPVAWACEGAQQRVRLKWFVGVSAQERVEFGALPALRVLSADAPPMARYDAGRQTYAGVGVDVLCVIAGELGLRYEMIPAREQTVAERIAAVQQGRADVFLPLSHLPARAQQGVFTQPFFESYYAVIARKGGQMRVGAIADLARLRVGVVRGVALEPALRTLVRAERLVVFDVTNSDDMFAALRAGAIDVVVYSQSIFNEKRYQHEYFDLEVVHTLHEAPRGYRFYFSPTDAHRRLAAVFDRYLAALDVSSSVIAHQQGERELIARYTAQRSARGYWAVVGAALALAALLLVAVLLRYRRLARRLTVRNRQFKLQQQDLRSANRELERQRQTDGLTAIANRRQFDVVLRREHARALRSGAPLSLLLIDIDYFKRVNDHYGHAMGDDYLRAVARVLRASVGRPADLVARYGGEEFACLLPDTGAADAHRVAERIRAGVAELGLHNVLAPTPRLTLSVGIATLAGAKTGAQAFVDAADAQLYAAKRAGRDRVHGTVLAPPAVAGDEE